MTDAQTARAIARRLWKEHGGAQHGPHVETLTMPLDRFNGFIDALVAAALATERAAHAETKRERDEAFQKYVDANEARIDAEAQLAEARKALEPFANIEPSTAVADDGSEAEPYRVYLACRDRFDFTGADLAAARRALEAQEGK